LIVIVSLAQKGKTNNMNDPLIKTIAVRFPEFTDFFTEAKKYALQATPSSKDKVNFHFVSYQWYEY